MQLEDLIGGPLDLDGRSCWILAAAPVVSNGATVLNLVTLATEAPDGRTVFGGIPIIATATAGDQAPRMVRPRVVFDQAGRFVTFTRPIAEHVADLAWIGMAGETYRPGPGGWPARVTILSEADQARAALAAPPRLDETEKRIWGRLIRLGGVALVDADGPAVSDRDPAAVLEDARERLHVLRRAGAPATIIRDLEDLAAKLGGEI